MRASSFVRTAPPHWFDYAYAGVVIVDHPDNGATLRSIDGALINPSPQIGGPIDISLGEAIAYRRRQPVARAHGDAAELESAYETFLA